MYNRETVGLIQIVDLKKNNDYAMWFEIIEKTNGYRLPMCLAYYCKRKNSISSGNKFKLIKYHYILFRKALKKTPIISVLLTLNNLIHGFIKKIVYRRYI